MNLARLRGLRAEKRLTQKEMAQEMQITEAAYSLKENGKRNFTVNELEKICSILNVDTNFFCQ